MMMSIENCYCVETRIPFHTAKSTYSIIAIQGSVFLYITEESMDSTAQFEAAQKDTRMTFHPVYELPMMRKWFQKNRNPTEEVSHTIAGSTTTLHLSSSRMRIPSLTIT